MDANEILTFLTDNGTIDRTTIELQIEMQKKQKYLNMHTFNIWKGKNGGWYTFLPDKEKGRRLIKRVSKDDLETLIVTFYEEEESNPTFKDVFQQWIETKLSDNEICKGTYDRYINDYKRFFGGKQFERYRIKNITDQELDRFIRDTLSGQNVTRKAYTGFRTLIKGTFKYAKKMRYTNISISNFFQDLELSRRTFKVVSKSPEEEVFNEDEIPKIITWLKDRPTPGNLGLVLAFQTGLRTGELAALKASDIEGDTLHVQRQEIRYKIEAGKQAHDVVEYTKTEAGNRRIILPASAIETIRQLKDINPSGEYLIMERGKRLLVTTYSYRIRAACEGCHIPVRSMHKIRKTYGTTLIDNGVDKSLIKAQMGHSDISTTMHYYYFVNKNKDKQREQIKSAINF